MALVNWQNIQSLASKAYTCGYCGQPLSSEKGYFGNIQGTQNNVFIYICHVCFKPTFFDITGNQTPKAKAGNEIKGIDDQSVKDLYDEARKAAGGGAPTATVMACRVILMHLAVAKGILKKTGSKKVKELKFEQCVNFLIAENYVPKGLEKWGHHIRKMGGRANHEITIMTDAQAIGILKFTEELLKIIYELPEELKKVEERGEVKPKLEIQPQP